MTTLTTLTCSRAPTERVLRALTPLGVLVRQDDAPPDPRPTDLAALLALPAGRIALLAGPSGCGKSTLLRAHARAARARRIRVLDARALLSRAPTERALLDLFSSPLGATQRLLSLAGLGEAALWARSTAELSEGQRARLAIALAMARAPARTESCILIDEFCSTLDRVTARAVSRTLRAWTRSMPHARVVCATAHDDLTDALRADLVIVPGVHP